MGFFGRKDSPETQPVSASAGFLEPDPPTWSERVDELLERLDGHDARLHELAGAIRELEGELVDVHERQKRQTIAIEEGIQHVDRSERRVRAVVQRAQRRVRDAGGLDEGLEAEAQEFLEFDDDGGREEGVQPMLEGVDDGDQAADAADWTGIPGEVTASNLRELGIH